MFVPLGTQTWALDTGDLNDTLATGAFFIFVAYVLQPAINSAYNRVRAYHAWRAIEKSQTVEVTQYSMATEIFGGRGKWDNARVVTVTLAVFSLAAWGLELSLSRSFCAGNADLLHRPPPVVIGRSNGTDHWQVITRQDLDGCEVHNVFDDYALSRYYMVDGNRRNTFVNGGIVAAYWSAEAATKPALFYYVDGVSSTVDSLECGGDQQQPERLDVYNGDVNWGSAVECEIGPNLTSNWPGKHADKNVAPPTIILNCADGGIFLVVAETSSYPRFLYSVWTVGSENGNRFELSHLFQVGATMQLAEAIVTALVQGERSGGACFGLLRKYSERREPYRGEVERASPFGEHPNGPHMMRLENVEIIECGLELTVNALLCVVCLLWLTLVGGFSSLYLRSRIEIDVYNRDELIRAVSWNGSTKVGIIPPSVRRTFVRKDSTGNISVMVSDAGNDQSGIARILGRDETVIENTDTTETTIVVVSDTGNVQSDGARILGRGETVIENADTTEPTMAPSESCGSGDATVTLPVGSRTVCSGGVRTGTGRTLPSPNSEICYTTSVP